MYLTQTLTRFKNRKEQFKNCEARKMFFRSGLKSGGTLLDLCSGV